jgi:hypothetical protein
VKGGHLGGAESDRGGGEVMCMSSLRTTLATAAITLLALSPASAMAAGSHSHSQPQLGGNPQMRVIDAHHATLNFASDRLARGAYGKLDAKITFVNGARVTGLKAVGTHGSDIRYAATVSSSKPLKLHQKYTVKFRLGDAKTVERFVKLFNPGEHG